MIHVGDTIEAILSEGVTFMTDVKGEVVQVGDNTRPWVIHNGDNTYLFRTYILITRRGTKADSWAKAR